jgi:hypothetical protein
MLATPADEMAGTMSLSSVTDAVALEAWSAQHRAFIVETFFKNRDSVIKTQRIFPKHFNISRHGKVPCRNTIQLWVENFRTSTSALKKETTRQCAYSAMATEH